MLYVWWILLLALVLGIFYILYQKDMREKREVSWLMQSTMQELNSEVRHTWQQALADFEIQHPVFVSLQQHLKRDIVGMDAYIHALFLTILVGGHALVEGVPGLAKTKTITLLSHLLDLSFHRIQFTPDMLPGDIVGTEIFDPKTQGFTILKWPIFAHCVLADEINRTTPKVQSALLEAMQEGQVTISGKTFPLPKPFFVLATQNPLEHEGTYPLPEAQIDRFLMHIVVDYPNYQQEQDIVKQQAMHHQEKILPIVSADQLLSYQEEVQKVAVTDALIAYAVRLVQATRSSQLFRLWASPRASLAIMQTAKAVARLRGSQTVTIEDIQMIALPVLRHRVVQSYEQKRGGIRIEDQLVDLCVHVPIIA
jgi:MoxR-like ATPase